MAADPPDHSGWKDVDDSSDPGWYVRFLERSRTNQIARIARSPDQELGGLRLAPGLHVLDVGCGIGALTSTLVPFVAPGGSVLGVDVSHVMIEEARRRHSAPPPPQLQFEVGDATRLPLPSASFDRTVCNMVLEHVPSVDAALREMVRVTRPGGWVAVWDADNATHVVATGDPQMDRRMTDAFAAEILHPYGIRDVPAMLHTLGLGPVEVTADTIVVRGAGEQGFLPVLDDFLTTQVRRRTFTADEAEWVRTRLNERLDEGSYLESFTHFRVAAQVPARAGSGADSMPVANVK